MQTGVLDQLAPIVIVLIFMSGITASVTVWARRGRTDAVTQRRFQELAEDLMVRQRWLDERIAEVDRRVQAIQRLLEDVE
ncbi:hypothetical protein [Saccharopolyspora pogona]|uniref:hypothetical protein n=1 Tax=Saccharopolyspora pogona TaxID=333966 RepID=UPI0016830D40|nr:hypothetical protein [Saccharopolyspora pogona]